MDAVWWTVWPEAFVRSCQATGDHPGKAGGHKGPHTAHHPPDGVPCTTPAPTDNDSACEKPTPCKLLYDIPGKGTVSGNRLLKATRGTTL